MCRINYSQTLWDTTLISSVVLKSCPEITTMLSPKYAQVKSQFSKTTL